MCVPAYACLAEAVHAGEEFRNLRIRLQDLGLGVERFGVGGLGFGVWRSGLVI